MKKFIIILVCLLSAHFLFARSIDGVWIAKSLYEFWIKDPYREDLPAKTVNINNKTYLNFINNVHLRTDEMTLAAVGALGI